MGIVEIFITILIFRENFHEFRKEINESIRNIIEFCILRLTSEPLRNRQPPYFGGCTTSTNCVVYVNFTKLSELSICVHFEFRTRTNEKTVECIVILARRNYVKITTLKFSFFLSSLFTRFRNVNVKYREITDDDVSAGSVDGIHRVFIVW